MPAAYAAEKTLKKFLCISNRPPKTPYKQAFSMIDSGKNITLIRNKLAVKIGLPVKGHGFHLIPFRTQKLNRVPFPAVVWS